MPLFRKRKAPSEPPPPSFDDVVKRALRALGNEFDLRPDHVEIKLSYGWRSYNLDALRARMEARPPDTWLGIATKDLRETVELAEREGPLPEWDEAKTKLKLRMHLRTNVPPAYPLGVPFGDDVIGVLAIDKGDSATLVKLVDANHWGRPFEDLLTVARTNTQAEPELEHQRITLKEGGGEAVLCSSKRWFGASQALWPERLLGEVGRFGALVAAPNPHVAMAYAIEDRRTTAAISVLEPWTQRRVEATSAPISPHLYWWRPGNILRLDDERRAELEAMLPEAEPEKPAARTTTGGHRVSFKRPQQDAR